MKTLRIVIERSKDSYWAYAENIEGISGVGDNVKDAKESAEQSIQIQKDLGNIPNTSYKIRYRFDAQSLLNYYKNVFTNAALERMTGINQKQIQHYSTGLKSPRRAQVKKIEKAFHELGNELLAVEL
jgi:hypothetical protein